MALLGLTDRERAVGRDAPGDCKRGLQKVGRFNDTIDQSPGFRLVAR